MTVTTKLIYAVGFAATLAACGSSSNDTSSFSELETEGLSIVDRFNNTPGTVTAEMPAAGSATYNGVAAFVTEQVLNEDFSNAEILSRMTMTANFVGATTVDGRFDNFRDLDNTAISGAVVWEQTNIVDSAFQTTASGTLSDGTDSADIALDIAGAFSGENADFVVGATTGTAIFEDFESSLSGLFIGEK